MLVRVGGHKVCYVSEGGCLQSVACECGWVVTVWRVIESGWAQSVTREDKCILTVGSSTLKLL